MGQRLKGLPIPPKSMRWGVGPFADAELFVNSGQEHLSLVKRLAHLKETHKVLDVGCGCGRISIHMQQFLNASGSYTGFDPDRAAIEWCNQNIARDDSRFTFHHLNLVAPPFSLEGNYLAEDLQFPDVLDVDLAILSSVFTHMLEPGIENYIRNLKRVVKIGGRCLVSGLLMNQATQAAVLQGSSAFSFTHPVGPGCWTFNPDNPTEGISNEETWIFNLFEESGFEKENIEYGNWRQQDRDDSHQLHDWFTVKKVATP